jgi:type I restriction enzyme S subunit
VSTAELSRVKDQIEGGDRWPQASLKDVCLINPRRTSPPGQADNAPTSFVPMAAVDAQAGIIGQRLERPFSEVKKGFTYFNNGDVIFAKITPCMQNGKHAICTDLLNGFGFGSTEFHVLRPGAGLRAEWLHYFLRQQQLLRKAEEHLTGAVGQQRLPEGYLAELEIPLPPVAEQERVAGRLTRALAAVDAARGAAQGRLAAAESLPAAYLREIFEGPEAAKWENISLASISQEISKGTTPLSFGYPYTTEGVPFLAAEDLAISGVDTASVGRFISNECHEFLRRSQLLPNDVLISIAGTLGRVSFLAERTGPANCNQAVAFIRLFPTLADRDFVVYALRSGPVQSKLRGQAIGGGVTNLNLPMIRQVDLPHLPLPDQRRVAADLSGRFESAKSLIDRCREELAAIDALPTALMREAFNGDS